MFKNGWVSSIWLCYLNVQSAPCQTKHLLSYRHWTLGFISVQDFKHNSLPFISSHDEMDLVTGLFFCIVTYPSEQIIEKKTRRTGLGSIH